MGIMDVNRVRLSIRELVYRQRRVADVLSRVVDAADEDRDNWAVADMYVVDIAVKVLRGRCEGMDVEAVGDVTRWAAFGVLAYWGSVADIEQPDWKVAAFDLIHVALGECDEAAVVPLIAKIEEGLR